VLIYAAAPEHPLGREVLGLLSVERDDGVPVGIGSLLLLPEVLSHPIRLGGSEEVRILASLLSRLDLRPLDRATAELATTIAASHRLRAADAVHLATAISAGADRFLTNNRRDFPQSIGEIDVVYPSDLREVEQIQVDRPSREEE